MKKVKRLDTADYNTFLQEGSNLIISLKLGAPKFYSAPPEWCSGGDAAGIPCGGGGW